MDDIQLVAIIEQQERQAIGYFNGEIAEEQATALDYYNGKPLGNEEEGRSSVVSSDVWDVVEGMTPQIMRPFVSSDDILKFNAHGPEDEAGAEQESDYINYVVTQKNNVFEQLTSWVKTGLLQKNGIVKYFWDTSRQVEIERYYGLTDDQFALLMQEIDGNDDYTIKAHTEIPGGVVDGPNGPEMAPPTHDIELRVTRKAGSAKYEVVPPEEFLISRDARGSDPKNASFVEHRRKMTLSAIREMGYEVDEKDIDSMSDDTTLSQQSLARNNAEELDYETLETSDDSMRETYFREIYMLTDYDDDGIAELRKICMVGKRILTNEETEEIPFCSWTPYLQPFKFYGRCPADETIEIQTVKTTLVRQTLDNLYTINNNRTVVSNEVNIDDILDNAIGGVVRLKKDNAGPVSNHVMPMPVQPIAQATQPMVEYWDTAKENRTGFTRYSQGMDSNSLNKTATGVRIITEQSNMKMEMISRTFAEVGLKPLMLGIHGLCRRHSTQAEVLRLRGKWVTVDPRSWKTRYDMTISVGLGNSDKQMQMEGINNIIVAQKNAAPLGIVDKEQIYNSHIKLAETLGYKNGDMYFKKPDDAPQIPPELQQQIQQMQQAIQGLQQENQQLKQETALKAKELEIKEGEVAGKLDIEQQKVNQSTVEIENQVLKGALGEMQDQLVNQGELLQQLLRVVIANREEE